MPDTPTDELLARAQKASQCIYIAVEPEVAGDISEILTMLCATVERLTRERDDLAEVLDLAKQEAPIVASNTRADERAALRASDGKEEG